MLRLKSRNHIILFVILEVKGLLEFIYTKKKN